MKYLICRVSESGPTAVLWWGPNRNGYTTDVDKAGRYTEEEIKEIENRHKPDIAVPEDMVQEMAIKVVPWENPLVRYINERIRQ